MDTQLIRRNLRRLTLLLAGVLIVSLAIISAGCASVSDQKSGAARAVNEESSIREKWGIEVIGIRVSAAGHMLDFGYRVIDPEKAAALLQKQVKPYVIDQASGAKMTVPRTRLGPMRQTAVLPEANRNYRILFANAVMVKPGSKVTVILGDVRIEDLVVE